MKFLDEDCGGVPHGRAIKCVVPGGVSSKVLTRADIANLPAAAATVTPISSRFAVVPRPMFRPAATLPSPCQIE